MTTGPVGKIKNPSTTATRIHERPFSVVPTVCQFFLTYLVYIIDFEPESRNCARMLQESWTRSGTIRIGELPIAQAQFQTNAFVAYRTRLWVIIASVGDPLDLIPTF